MWQLGIITTGRKPNILLETVKQLLSLTDNKEITKLLIEYQQDAICLSQDYQQVAEDILWYGKGNKRIERQKDITAIQGKWLDEEVIIVGSFSKDSYSYHASLQKAAKEELWHAPSIKKKYGYIGNITGLEKGRFIKRREYLKMEHPDYVHISPDNLYQIPSRKIYRVYLANKK